MVIRLFTNKILFLGSLLSWILIVICDPVLSQHSYTIEKLPEGINSEYEELKPLVSAGGDSLYFVRSYFPGNAGGEHAGEDIWLSVYEKGSGWSQATNRFGYPNHPGPDILISAGNEQGTMLVLDYASTGKKDFAVIKKVNPGTRDGIKISMIHTPTGDDFHDMFLNQEENVLLISMHSLNSIGKEDLYVSLKSDYGEWSTPVNLGQAINTRGFEISPFLSEDGRTLYFASDGHPGKGDADLFYSKRMGSGWEYWSEPVNMGSPFNSPRFDAGLSTGTDGDFFLVSNREGEYADIYHVITKEDPPVYADIDIEPEIERSGPTGMGEIMQKNNIPGITLYFEFDEHIPGSAELEKLETFVGSVRLFKNTGFRIAGFTDNTGSESYNLKLSQKRARFVYRYLISSGIERDRLTMEGFGIYMSPGEREIPASAKRRVEITGIPGSARQEIIRD